MNNSRRTPPARQHMARKRLHRASLVLAVIIGISIAGGTAVASMVYIVMRTDRHTDHVEQYERDLRRIVEEHRAHQLVLEERIDREVRALELRVKELEVKR